MGLRAGVGLEEGDEGAKGYEQVAVGELVEEAGHFFD